MVKAEGTTSGTDIEPMFAGSIPALVTPMHEDGSLDLGALSRLVDFQVDQGSDGLVIVGTTGESPTVNVDEHCELIEHSVQQAAGRIKVIAGAGGNSTEEAINLTRFAKKAGAAAVLSVVPYYNKPTQEGLYRHFRRIAEAVDIPLILYNVPGRTVADLAEDTTLRLAEIPNIIGLKDATGDLGRAVCLVERAPPGFCLLSGEDMTAVFTILLGYHGTVSVTANVAPRAMHDMCVAARKHNATTSIRLHRQLCGLHRELFCEPSPVPVKWAVSQMGLTEHGIRLPMTPLSAEAQPRVRAAMRQAGVAT